MSRRSRIRQRGVAALLILFLIVIGTAGVLIQVLNIRQQQQNRDRVTAEALAQAKAALIAWSIGPEPSRPGTLPCPAANELGSQAGSCSVGGGTTLGRLPWKTLGIDDLRDADGEQLWYALSNNFRRTGLTNAAINSDTAGNLLLYASDGMTLISKPGEELAAIVFSPGPPLSGQDRAAGTNTATNYLESAYSGNNANAAGPFVTGPVKDNAGNILANDRALGISARELISASEKRALNEAQKALARFAIANGGKYPNPAPASCTLVISNVGSPNTCNSDSTRCFGRLPEDVFTGTMVQDWFKNNGWGRVMIYAVNKNRVIDGSAAECSSALSMDGNTRAYVLIAPGTAKYGQTRPSTSLSNYLEDAANADAWNSTSSAQPSFNSPTPASNDQARSMP